MVGGVCWGGEGVGGVCFGEERGLAVCVGEERGLVVCLERRGGWWCAGLSRRSAAALQVIFPTAVGRGTEALSLPWLYSSPLSECQHEQSFHLLSSGTHKGKDKDQR